MRRLCYLVGCGNRRGTRSTQRAGVACVCPGVCVACRPRWSRTLFSAGILSWTLFVQDKRQKQMSLTIYIGDASIFVPWLEP